MFFFLEASSIDKVLEESFGQKPIPANKLPTIKDISLIILAVLLAFLLGFVIFKSEIDTDTLLYWVGVFVLVLIWLAHLWTSFWKYLKAKDT